jgi:hypothetical protein
MVELNGVYPGSVVASVSGLIRLAQFEDPSHKELHEIDHSCVDRMIGFRNGACLQSMLRATVFSLRMAVKLTTTGICRSGTAVVIQ